MIKELLNYFGYCKKEEIKKEEKYSIKNQYYHNDDNSDFFEEVYKRNFQRSAFDDFRVVNKSKFAMDSVEDYENIKASFQANNESLPASIYGFLANQGFIGYQNCSILAQNWLIDKACAVPAEDAMRNDYEITVNDGTYIPPELIDAMRKYDKKFDLKNNAIEFVHKGRTFGVRHALFEFDMQEDERREFLEKPFNLDSVRPKSYKGIRQIDPYWMVPELDEMALVDPTKMRFYKPTHWMAMGRLIHHSHFVVMINSSVSDYLKPTYFYGGIPLTQKIFERVYGGERIANEAPNLAVTKRQDVLKTNLGEFVANQAEAEKRINFYTKYRNNYSLKLIDTNEEMQRIDTSLGDLDNIIMTEYQLVAAVSGMPATKLLGVSPKGFHSSGKYEESNYHETLESIQETHLVKFLERHYQILIRSEILPKFNIKPFNFDIVFKPVDSSTDIEKADINLKKAQADQIYHEMGVISASDIQRKIISDKDSGYNGLELEEIEEELPDEENSEIEISNEGENSGNR